MFGGYDGARSHNDTYLLDMETWVRVYTHTCTCNRHNTMVLLVLVYISRFCTVYMYNHVYMYTCMYIIHIILIVTCYAT